MRAIAILALCVVAAYGADESQYAYNYLSDTGCRTAAQGPTVGLQRMCQWLEDNYSGQPWWQSDCGHVPSRTTSLHCAGRAIDWVMNGCTSAGLAEGNRIVSYLVSNNGAQAKARGVQTIIWRGKIWTKNGDFSERAYTTQGVGYTCSQGNTAAKTQSHWDHVHLDLNIWGSRNFPYGGAAPTNAPAPAPAGCTTKFCVNQQVRFTTVVNLRSSASPTGTKVATSTNGEIATVIGGPTNNGGYEWYQLRRASGATVYATHGGQDWYVLYRGTGNADVAPDPTIIAPANTTVYSDICIEGTTKNVTQSFFTILAQSVDSCGKSWYEVEVVGDTNTWYLPFDNTTMLYNAGAPEAEEPSDIDILGSVGRAAPSLVVAAVAALFAMRV